MARFDAGPSPSFSSVPGRKDCLRVFFFFPPRWFFRRFPPMAGSICAAASTSVVDWVFSSVSVGLWGADPLAAVELSGLFLKAGVAILVYWTGLLERLQILEPWRTRSSTIRSKEEGNVRIVVCGVALWNQSTINTRVLDLAKVFSSSGIHPSGLSVPDLVGLSYANKVSIIFRIRISWTTLWHSEWVTWKSSKVFSSE